MIFTRTYQSNRKLLNKIYRCRSYAVISNIKKEMLNQVQHDEQMCKSFQVIDKPE